jgi:hypothetical protein
MAIENKNGVDGKYCSTCDEWKSLADFPKDASHGPLQGGCHCRCKACHKKKRAEKKLLSLPAKAPQLIAQFQIELGTAAFTNGIINAPVAVDSALGKDGEPFMVYLGSAANGGIPYQINRTANQNGAVRITGGNAVARWFQAHFKQGEKVVATILTPNEVFLHKN